MNIIKEHIFPSHDLSNNQIETILSESSGSNVDLSDIYMQYSTVESWTCEDGIVKNGSQHIDSGYGIRAISNEATGFSYGNNFDYSEIIKAAKLSKSIVESKETKSINLKHENDFKRLYVSESPITSLTDKEKVTFLREIDNYIKKKDKRVQQVIINLSSSHDSIFVANSYGKYCFDERPLVRFNVMVILKSGDRVERGSAGGGGRYTYSNLLNTKRQAILSLEQRLYFQLCKVENLSLHLLYV